jgi:microcystin-dependent protein
MSEPFLSEIRIMSYNFAPKGWAMCNGQFLPINQNQALFSLLGTTYGGNGQSTFALPDLQGRSAMHPGQGPGLSPRYLGEASGSDVSVLQPSETPLHTHTLTAQGAPGDTSVPAGDAYARAIGATPYEPPAGAPLVAMAPQALAPVGGDQPHNNMQPYLTMNFCIALQGVFPARP